MATLDFKGPFHWEHTKEKQLIDILSKSFGVYIWGFMFEITNEEIGNIVDCKNNIPNFQDCLKGNQPFGFIKEGWIFIPYYVGRALHAKKGTNTLLKRINDHHSTSSKAGFKYTRLAMSYYKDFFRDKKFPLPVVKGDWISKGALQTKLTNQYVSYFNNEVVLRNIYGFNPVLDGKDCPINLQKYINEDTLDQIINSDCKNTANCTSKNHLNNFWFCYLDLSTMNDMDNTIKDLETQVYYSLNGKTVSNTKRLIKNKYNKFTFGCNSTCEHIFKMNPTDINGKIEVNDTFDGYIK
jgi:hypothetical protein